MTFRSIPPPDALSFSITYLNHYIKPDTIEICISGIYHQLEHDFPDVHSSRKSPLKPTPSTLDTREPRVLVEFMPKNDKAYDPHDYFLRYLRSRDSDEQFSRHP